MRWRAGTFRQDELANNPTQREIGRLGRLTCRIFLCSLSLVVGEPPPLLGHLHEHGSLDFIVGLLCHLGAHFGVSSVFFRCWHHVNGISYVTSVGYLVSFLV